MKAATRSIVLLCTLLTTMMLNAQIFPEKYTPNNREIETQYYNKLYLTGDYTIYVVDGLCDKIIVEADQDILKSLSAFVKDSSLYVLGSKKFKTISPINVFLALSELKNISIDGKCKIVFYSNVTSKLAIDLREDNSDLILKYSGDFFDCEISGYGFLELAGMFNTLNINGRDEVTITLDVVTKNLICNLSDLTFGNFYGTAETLNVFMYGESYLKAFNFLVKDCYAEINQTSEAQVNVSDNLEVAGVRDGYLQYRGVPKISLIDDAQAIYVKSRKDRNTMLGIK